MNENSVGGHGSPAPCCRRPCRRVGGFAKFVYGDDGNGPPEVGKGVRITGPVENGEMLLGNRETCERVDISNLVGTRGGIMSRAWISKL